MESLRRKTKVSVWFCNTFFIKLSQTISCGYLMCYIKAAVICMFYLKFIFKSFIRWRDDVCRVKGVACDCRFPQFFSSFSIFYLIILVLQLQLYCFLSDSHQRCCPHLAQHWTPHYKVNDIDQAELKYGTCPEIKLKFMLMLLSVWEMLSFAKCLPYLRGFNM